ncbi:MAG: cytochrome c oxidase assembly protein [Hyphomicrobiaceae bacterium]|nr:cytochrome c oxidase assembly protein [Hyphomicrobiaceae bacterium]
MTLGPARAAAAIAGSAAGLALAAAPAEAHSPMPAGADGLWSAWSADPYALVPLLAACLLYGRGVVRLWRRAGREPAALSRLHVALFTAGGIVVLLALTSPLERLAGLLLAAHMAQHLLLMTLAPLLLIAGRPDVAYAWALPRSWIEAVALGDGWRLPRRMFRAAVRPFPATLLHGTALWVWHAPAAFDAALRSPALHALEHAMFLGTALLFWRSITGAAHVARTSAAAILATLITVIHSGFLGALLTFAPRPLYSAYAGGLPDFGLTPLGDQQLAGLLMWVPAGLFYLAAVLLLAWRLLDGDAPDRPLRLPG